jgi:hypothetical protein
MSKITIDNLHSDLVNKINQIGQNPGNNNPVGDGHTHANKDILDSISEDSFVTINSLQEYLKQNNYLTTTDISNCALKSDIPTKTSQLINDSNYITISALSNYALKSDIPSISNVPKNLSDLNNDMGFITSIPSEYITESELDAKNYVTTYTLNGKGYITESALTSKDYMPKSGGTFSGNVTLGTNQLYYGSYKFMQSNGGLASCKKDGTAYAPLSCTSLQVGSYEGSTKRLSIASSAPSSPKSGDIWINCSV